MNDNDEISTSMDIEDNNNSSNKNSQTIKNLKPSNFLFIDQGKIEKIKMILHYVLHLFVPPSLTDNFILFVREAQL